MSQAHLLSAFQSNPATPINHYRRDRTSHPSARTGSQTLAQTVRPLPQPNPQTTTTAPKSSRRRGVVLTQQGWQKLVQAGVLYDDFGKRYTHEELSERSLLDVRTVSRMLSCEVKVDKRSLKTFFLAFNLQVEANDYTTPECNTVGKATTNTAQHQAPTAPMTEVDLPAEELMQLKQRMIETYTRLFDLLGLDRNHES